MTTEETIDPTAWEPLPTYMELISKSALSVQAFTLNTSNCYSIGEDWEFAKTLLLDFPRCQVMLLVAITVSLTVTRAVMSAYIFEPLSRWLRLTPSDSAKFPESAWKLLVYTILWAFSFEVIVISQRHDYLQRPTRIWNFSDTVDRYTQPLPGDIFWMYILQLSFYLHSIYATIYMDVWRKDSVTMLFHHCITIFLLQFSFLVKYHKIGSLVLFLHDISDVFLEFTKINVYLKHRGRRFHAANDMLSSIGFVAFAGSWAFFRLYWFPLKVLYSTTWGVYVHQKGTKGPRLFIYFNIMLWLLLALHIYWFWFILVLMYRIATGQLKELDDTREYDSGCGSSGEESAAEGGSGPRTKSSHSAQNGSARHGRRERHRDAAAHSNGCLTRRHPAEGDRSAKTTNGCSPGARQLEQGDTGLPAPVANGWHKEHSEEEEEVSEEAAVLANGSVQKEKDEEEVVTNGCLKMEEEKEKVLTNGSAQKAGDDDDEGEEEEKEEEEELAGEGEVEVLVNGSAHDARVVVNGSQDNEDEEEGRSGTCVQRKISNGDLSKHSKD